MNEVLSLISQNLKRLHDSEHINSALEVLRQCTIQIHIKFNTFGGYMSCMHLYSSVSLSTRNLNV